MSRRTSFGFFMMLVCLFVGVGARAQKESAWQERGTLQPQPTQNVVVPRLVRFAGALKDEQGKPVTGTVGVTFAIYKEQEGGAALWLETQNVELDEHGNYTVLLGSSKSEGLPLELFLSGEPRWLGVQVNLPKELEQPRVLLVSVPYALKAADADTLGGKPLSSFVLTNAAGGSSGGTVPIVSGPIVSQATIGGGGTQNFVAEFDATGANVINSSIFDTGTNVGIGTNNPARTLHIKSAAPVIRLEDSTLPNSFWELQQSAFVNDTFGFLRYENSSAVESKSFVVSSAGNLGIGTGTPQRKLHIKSATPVIRLEDTNLPNSYWELQQSAFALDTLGFLRYENNAAVQSKSFVMSSAGNFGIGTGTPTQKLEVVGNVKITGAGNALTFPDGSVMSSAATGVGGGTITGVTAGTGLTGGGSSGNVGLAVDSTVARTSGSNSFAGQQNIAGNLNVTGNIQIAGTGNGLQFADGTTQTTAPAASAGWTGPSVPFQTGTGVFAAWNSCATNPLPLFTGPAPPPGTRAVIELVSFNTDNGGTVQLTTTVNGGQVSHYISDAVGYRIYADLSAGVTVKFCAPPCTGTIDPVTGVCSTGTGSNLDFTMSGFIYGGTSAASSGWTGPSTPFQNATGVFAAWNTCASSMDMFQGPSAPTHAAIEFVSFSFNAFDKRTDVLLEINGLRHHMFNDAEFKPVGYRLYADLSKPVRVRAVYCPGQCPGVDPMTGVCPPNSPSGDNLNMTVSGFIY